MTVPANTPVLVIATNLTEGDRGIGSINLLSVFDPATGEFLEWSGVNLTSSQSQVPNLTGWNSFGAGTTMVKVGYSSFVTLRISDGDHFVVHNSSTTQETGTVWILPAPLS